MRSPISTPIAFVTAVVALLTSRRGLTVAFAAFLLLADVAVFW